MDAAAHARREIERDLRRAIERDELVLHYQPQVALDTGEVVGFEALLRWRHPERGPVPPDLFIPAAEASGDILGIGAWVLDEACREAARWAAPLRVAVNVSPVQAQRGTAFAETVEFGALGRDEVREASVSHALHVLLEAVQREP